PRTAVVLAPGDVPPPLCAARRPQDGAVPLLDEHESSLLRCAFDSHRRLCVGLLRLVFVPVPEYAHFPIAAGLPLAYAVAQLFVCPLAHRAAVLAHENVPPLLCVGPPPPNGAALLPAAPAFFLPPRRPYVWPLLQPVSVPVREDAPPRLCAEPPPPDADAPLPVAHAFLLPRSVFSLPLSSFFPQPYQEPCGPQ